MFVPRRRLRLLSPKGSANAATARPVYQAAVANLKLAIEESGAELTAGHLPSVLGDVVQITQLFQNLLANAIKFKARERRPTAIDID